MTLKDILPSELGFGAAPLGNMFRNIPEPEALATVEAAWNDGIRYFDNAPFYGAGLAELRMGEVLAEKPRDEFAISTKSPINGPDILSPLRHVGTIHGSPCNG